MLQSLPIVLKQVKAGNTSENLLNEIQQIIYFFVSRKRNYLKSISQIMKSIQIQYKKDTTFMNLKNSKTSDPQRKVLIR